MGSNEQTPKNLPLTELTAISILDGRNRKNVVEIAPYVSEYSLIRTRVDIEACYLVALSDEGIVRKLSPKERDRLKSFGGNLSLEDAEKVKKIEDELTHDVKAMERTFRTMLEGTSLKDFIEAVHMGLTSEDVNNLAYRLMLRRVTQDIFIPTLDILTNQLVKKADTAKTIPMLARTHGQPAVPTTLGKELIVFASRLNKEVTELEDRPLTGKLTGAVGNLNALQFAYPDVDWIKFSEKFVRSFGFEPNLTTTQINPYEDVIAYFQAYKRINGIVLDFDQDMWRYVSDGWFVQLKKGKETGSSTMPQKVNPWRSENAEGNLGKANALFDFFATKLAVSRLQREMSDSTVIRDMGVPLGWSLLAYKNTMDQLGRIQPNPPVIEEALNKDWAILAEGAQTLMRSLGVDDPYTIMANLTQGRHIGENEWKDLVKQLPVNEEAKTKLTELTPQTYIGLAVEITEKAINEIRSSRK